MFGELIYLEVFKMLIDTRVTIAYKCHSCGTFEFFNTSLFKFLHKKEHILTCRCTNSSLVITEDCHKEYRIRIPCIGCGNDHIFMLPRKGLLSKIVNVLYCPETGVQLCFIGNDGDVRKKIDNLERELDELINLFGYDNYFKNTQVMFDVLNRIHDIAEQGNLICECGNKDIELVMLPDEIHLKCIKCPGNKIIKASSNNHLKDILIKQQIILSRTCSDYAAPCIKPDAGKTDSY